MSWPAKEGRYESNMTRQSMHNLAASFAVLMSYLMLCGSFSITFKSNVASRRDTNASPVPPFQSTASMHPCTYLLSTLGDLDESEETILRLHLSVKPDTSQDYAIEKVRQYTQSFPFSAILPVQPLQYLPTHDGGVDVVFLRKKTQEKGSVDGGIRFFVTPSDENGIDVLAKRNSQGQVISKAFSEKQIVQRFVGGITGKDPISGQANPMDSITVESIFHKWMSS